MKFYIFFFMLLAVFGFVLCGPTRSNSYKSRNNNDNQEYTNNEVRTNKQEGQRGSSSSSNSLENDSNEKVQPLQLYPTDSKTFQAGNRNGGYNGQTQLNGRGNGNQNQNQKQNQNQNRDYDYEYNKMKKGGDMVNFSQESKMYGEAQNNAGWMQQQNKDRRQNSVQERRQNKNVYSREQQQE